MKYFIIIDMQEDFLTGSLANPAAKEIVSAIAEKAKELEQQGYTIIATRDTHYSEDYLYSQEGKNLPIPHCIKGSEGWEVAKELVPFINRYIDKPSFGFNKWDLAFDGEEPVEEIRMCGTVTSICVASNFTILKSVFPEVPIYVHKDLCADLSKENHEAALSVIKSQQGIIV